ncbi:D-alanyl-D-alanine carboxypeptidase [Georgenia satyanarayanai]|uniref:D-alanyl-D-alanine carboxypeptidase n=1 Tax=Georgenia satyanarayanai TaxID=860221 RepID=A0A2Y8ZX93_9MICO|nr:D-alanyl-D-alanine carboxypeptidase-like protein [Georgenia satyanarayanai]SSA36684.1 D-alanyl-D-alanine carboxypeptidase [Georgenia satyanarayanai]
MSRGAFRTDRLDLPTVLEMQRTAGNLAVTGLLTRARRRRPPPRRVQRAPLDPKQDPKGYTQPQGVKNVASSGTTRRVVTVPGFGVTGGFKAEYTHRRKDPKTGEMLEVRTPSAERRMTEQSPDNTAVVVMPDVLDKNRPVQVVLHFHGFGFRGGTDPHAGYAVASGRSKNAAHGALGTVRDVDQEHWSQQIGAVNAARGATGPQTVAVLAQGRGRSEFGKVPTFPYVRAVLDAVPELAGVSDYSIVLSGHSGGGATQVAGKVADLRDAATPPADGTRPARPADVVVMFDAEGVVSVMSWAVGKVRELAAALEADPAGGQALIDASPRFRGYFAEWGGYRTPYITANRMLKRALATVPAAWTLAGSSGPGTKVEDLFRIVAVPGVRHETVISKEGPATEGALADALTASTSPTSDRAQALPWDARTVPELKAAKARAKAPAVQPLAVQRDDPAVPAAAPAKPRATTWKTSDAASDYALTTADTTLLGSQTAAERAADRAAFGTAQLSRIRALTKAAKKRALIPEETTELTDLQALRTKVENANRALRRTDVEEILDDAGFTVAGWYGDIQKGSFLGVPAKVHTSLADRLTQAETALVGDAAVNPSGDDAKTLGATLGMYGTASDLRAPKNAVGGSSLSLHTFGLAVDLNYKGNPFLGNQGKTAPDVVARATSLVTGTAVDVLTQLGDAQASFTALKDANDALTTYFSYREPANRPLLDAKLTGRTAAAGEPTDAAGWIKVIEQDHAALKDKGDFKKHKPPEEGFLDLDERVVMALTGAGLTWGGTYRTAKDIMHFDLREGDGGKVNKARIAHTDSR